MTEERAEEIAEAMPNDILRTYVLPAVRCPLTDNLIRKAVQFYLSADPRLKNSVIQRFGEIENWDVSCVTNMQDLFFLDPYSRSTKPKFGCWISPTLHDGFICGPADELFDRTLENFRSFNQPLNNWNVSNVTNMSGMFRHATSFNQPLNNWNVSKVSNMHLMFLDATSFNQPLDELDVSKVTDMEGMFHGARSFNQPLNNWDVAKVTNIRSLFSKATSFNQPLNNWNVSKVTDMEFMFSGATSFNQPLNDWNVANVMSMEEMFRHATSFNQPLNNWDVSKVKYMQYMFYAARSFNQPLDNWNLLHRAISLNQSIKRQSMEIDDSESDSDF